MSSGALGARLWALRYILGLKEAETLWADIKDVPAPVPVLKSKPTEAEKKAKRYYNKRRRPALGKEVHARIEQYYKHAQFPCAYLPVDWSDVPGTIALAGLQFLPSPAACAVIETESAVTVDTSFCDSSDDQIVFRGSKDLLTLSHDTVQWLLIDHKSTYTFDYIDREKTIKTVKTPAQLEEDMQANLYALDVMQKHRLTALACRWVYYRTEDGPSAKAVDFVITLANAERIVAGMVKLAKELRGYMRARKQPKDLPCDIGSCKKFGGCVYHPDQDGPCVPPEMSRGERLAQLHTKKQEKKASKYMPGFRDQYKKRNEEIAAAAAGSVTTNTEAQSEASEQGAQDAADAAHEADMQAAADAAQLEHAADHAQETSATAAPETAAPAVRRGPKPRAAMPAGSQAEQIAALAKELADVDAQRASVLARLREAVQ